MRGTATALVTPFHKDGSIDNDCFTKLVGRQIKGGVNLLVPCGTTGESVTMSEDERLRVIRLTVLAAKGTKAKVIAGTGSNNTAATIDFTRKAREGELPYLAKCGGVYSSEWYWSKIAHCMRTAPHVARAAAT